MLGKTFLLTFCVAIVAAKSFDFYETLQEGESEGDSLRGGQSRQDESEEGVERLLRRLLYIPIPDRSGQPQGYFTYIPESAIRRLEYESIRQAFLALRRRGVFPISSLQGRILGYYSLAAGGSQQQYEVGILSSALQGHGLLPIVSSNSTVVGIFSENPFINFRNEPNQSPQPRS